MLKKLKHGMIFFLFIFITSYGFLKVSDALPQFIKDRSPLKVSFNTKPLNITLETASHMVYINKEAADSIKNSAEEVIDNVSKNNPITKLINYYRYK